MDAKERPAAGGSRTRTKDLVRAEVRTVALRLFAERGFSAVTVADIAEASGISQRTCFRYFPVKEDFVVDEPAGYGERLREVLALRPADEAVWDSLRETLRLRTALWQQDPVTTRLVLDLWAQSPAVQARQRFKVATWREALVPETQRRLGRRDRHARLRATATVATVFACLDAAMTEWQHPDRTGASLDALFDAAIDAVRN